MACPQQAQLVCPREQLDEQTFDTAQADGRVMTLEEAVAEALAE
jgi:hypothetical protein